MINFLNRILIAVLLHNLGFVNETEFQAISNFESPHPKYWLPIYWAMAAIKQARKEGKIASDTYVVDLYGVGFSLLIRDVLSALI